MSKLIMKNTLLTLVFLFLVLQVSAQDIRELDYYLNQAKSNTPALLENRNLEQIGELQNKLIIAQNKAFQINATSEILVAPYFDNNGKPIDITTTPSPNAFGYDVGVTNGGLYSAQLNVTKNLFNQSAIDNLLFQNKINNEAISLSSEEISHNLIKNITDIYITTYQLQLQEEFTKEILSDLENRLQVVELLVKRAVLMESDYLLLQLDIEGKKLELKQIQNNYKTSIAQLYSLCGIPLETVDKIAQPYIFFIDAPAEFFYNKKFENDSLKVAADQQVFNNQYKPQVSVYANTGLNAVELQNIEHRIGASAGLRLTIPIYDGKQRKYNELQNNLKKESLEHYRENSKIQLKNMLESIKQQTVGLEENMQLLEKQLQKQKNILEIYKGKLVQGQVSIVDYLNVIQNYKQNVYAKLQMQTNHWLLQSQYNFINW
ncbi:TolC family protein [Aequorivita nionensis]|uniref:TolC family protein n=1 Tax=Aequorivita nionensis TaxID=1287690 RepID=UPI003965A4BD